MNTQRLHLRPFAWLALVAVLAMALLPTVSHALAFARGGASAWAEVCTPQGMRVVAVDVAVDAGESPAPLQAAGHLEHCPFCALQNLDTAPPPVAVAPLLLPLNGSEPPPLFLHAPTTLHAWRTAQPRGPPTFA